MQLQRNIDPDELLTVLFKHIAVPDEMKSLEQGRPIFEDIEVCEIRSPGSTDVKVFPSTAISRWLVNPMTGQQSPESYAERFRHQYQQFKRNATQTKIGMPLDIAPFLSDARRAELRAQNIYTVEQLASIEGEELKHLGPGGREMKNAAEAFIAEALATVPNRKLMHELEQLRARNAILEEDMLRKKETEAKAEDTAAGEFENMSLDELRAFITANTGHAPHGSLNRKTLTRMATECRPDKAA